MDMFIILVVVRVSQMTCQIYQIMHFKYVKLLYANYNTIKLFVKSVHPSKTWPFKSTFPPTQNTASPTAYLMWWQLKPSGCLDQAP